MSHRWRGLAFPIVLASTTAAAAAAPARDEAPARWTGVALGDDRTGDLRPGAAALLDQIARTHGPVTVADAPILTVAPAPAIVAPTTIRIWRRGLDASTDS